MLEVAIEKKIDEFHLSSSFTVQNEILGVLGPSGSGKSMTLKCIAGLEKPSSGRIILNGKILYDSDEKIDIPPRLRKIGYVFQNYALFPHLTVYKNIEFGINHLSKGLQKEKVQDIVNRMGLTGLENRYPHELSGGQQQRVALARTLITNPELLLLDEPFSALDNHVKNQLEQDLLEMIHTHYNGEILFITHNLEEAYKLCDRLLIYDNGQTVQLGHKKDIMNGPATITVAKMTGCKNLLPVHVKKIEDHFHLTANTMVLTTNYKEMPYSHEMVAGIHSHQLKLKTTRENNYTNTFPCEVIDLTEGIASMNVNIYCYGHRLTATIMKEEWEYIKGDSRSLYVHIPEEHIFLVP